MSTILVVDTIIVNTYNYSVASPLNTSLLAREIGKIGHFASPEEEAYLSLLRTTSILARTLEPLFRRHGLSEPLYNALRIAAGHGTKGVPTLTIARQLVTLDPDVTRLVDRLEKAGLIRRERCERDRRVVFVKITPAGKSKLDVMNEEGASLLKEMLGHMGSERLVELIRLLEDVRKPHLATDLNE